MNKSFSRTVWGTQTSTWWPNNGSPPQQSKISSSRNWTETRSGTSVPDFEGKIARVEDATSSYSRFSATVALGSYNSTVEFTNPTWGGREVVSGVLPETIPNPLLSSKAYEIALGNFLTDCSRQVSPAKGMVFLGELRETLKMLKSPASSLRNGISAYLRRARKHQRRYGARLATKGIAGMWLEYALGWQPLLGSIRDAAIAYEAFEREYKFLRAFGKGSSSGASSSSTTAGLSGNYTRWIQDSVTSRETVVRFKGVARHEYNSIDGSRAKEIARLSGFTLAEFVPTIWELIPYSFVADYFGNIGDILNSAHGLTANWRWTSVAQESSATLRSSRRLNEPALKQLGIDRWSGGQRSPLEIVARQYDRWEPVLRLPTLVLELPPLGFKWATMLALATQPLNGDGIRTRR